MKKPIITIENANEATIEFLIKVGILFADENGIHVAEKQKKRRFA